MGRAWAAMREDESVAEAMGVSVRYKMLAFAIGAGIGCLGGAFFAAKIGSIFPNSFGLLVSINVLAVIVLGGMGSVPGVVVGALVLVGLPELLNEFAEYRLLFYGAILVAIMIFRPEGLIPNRRRRRELHVESDPSIAEDVALSTASERIDRGGALPMSLLEVQSVSKRFGGVQAVQGVDMVVDQGEIVGVIGPNGAGKTTLFNIVTGFYSPDEGTIIFDGSTTSPGSSPTICTAGDGPNLPVGAAVRNMTVLENAMVGQHTRTKSGSSAPFQGQGTHARREKIPERARQALAFFDDRLRLPSGPPRLRPGLRRSPAARDRPGDGHRAHAPAARRARRRDEPGREGGAHQADR